MLQLPIVKACTKCGQKKNVEDYFVRDKATGRRHAQCKKCYKFHRRTYYSAHYGKNKEAYLARAKLRREKLRADFRTRMLQYMSDKACVDCNENDIRVLELDHIDPNIKSFTISQAVKLGRNWSEVITEINKCRVLCSNCHKRRTAQQYKWYKVM